MMKGGTKKVIATSFFIPTLLNAETIQCSISVR